jgi:hypothetical protein
MSAPAGAPARAAYRQLLRAVARHVTSVSGNGLFRDALRAEFRAAAAQRDPAAVAAAVRRAEDAAFYITAVNEHKARAAPAARALRSAQPRVCAALGSRQRRRRTC